MIINFVSHYIPDVIVPNTYFTANHGISNEEIISKSGIFERRYCQVGENTNTMAIEAVKKALAHAPFPVLEVDLIIGATYTPYDTVGSLAHAVQKEFNIEQAKCFTVDSACSSFINALEIVDCYFANKRASKAIVVVSEHNSAYYDRNDKKSVFLWGDGAAAVLISNQRYSDDDFEIMDVNTTGLGHVGKSVDGVCLRPIDGGLKMPFGRDVFQYACTYMMKEIEAILKRNNIPIQELNYLITHQANSRISEYVVKKLGIKSSCVLSNIKYTGNTGSASTPIVLSQNKEMFKTNDTIVITVFGGGYSSGALLLKKL